MRAVWRTATRAEVEDFLFQEAELIDNWRLPEWEKLLTDDACYYVPPNDDLDGSHRRTLFIVADDRERIHQIEIVDLRRVVLCAEHAAEVPR